MLSGRLMRYPGGGGGGLGGWDLLSGFPPILGTVQVPSGGGGVSSFAWVSGWAGHIVAHGGAVTLCRLVFLYNLQKNVESVHLLTLINWG